MDWRFLPMKAGNLRLLCLVLGTLLCFAAVRLQAQQGVATVRGTVLDQNGGPVAGAVVTARAEGSQSASSSGVTAKTDPQGRFEFRQLAPGTYDLHASRSGFGDGQVQGLKVAAGKSKKVQLRLEAQAKQPAQEKPAATTTSGQVNETQLAGLPLNGRSYIQLATLQSEVLDPFGGSASRGGGGSGLYVSGSRSTSNNFLLDEIGRASCRERV